MKKASVFTVILLFMSTLVAYGWEVAVGPVYQDLDLSGKVKASGGTEIDVEKDLAIDNDKPVGVNFRLDAGKHNFDFSVASVEFSGTNTLNRTITFKNETFNVNTSVESTLEYNLYEGQYSYDLIDFQTGEDFGVTLSPLFKVSIYDASVDLKAAGVSATYSEVIPIPTIGALGQIDLNKYLSLLGQISGIGYSGDTYLEYKSVLRIKPIKYINFDVGYKGASIEFSQSDNLIDIDAKGLYLEGALVYQF